ncbi:MAG: VWA domain-containing protein [Ignavibacteriales bacterium]|nr:VWA domain-containing protein [Ignavibacteriales bacterium]
MRKNYIHLAIVFIMVISFYNSTYAQDWNLKILEIDTTSFPMLKVGFTIFGDKALMVKDLSKSDIFPFDGEKKIKNFDLKLLYNTEKLRVCVLLDVSGSMKGEKFINAKLALNEMLNVISATDQCALITFGTEVTSISGFTNDFNYLRNSIEDVILSKKTKLFDGLFEATKLFSSFEKTRNAIILITDGKDEGSVQDLQAVLAKSKRNNVEIYSIGMGDDADLYTLTKLSEETGAGYKGLINPPELHFVVSNIYELLTKSYELSFLTPDSIVQIASTKRELGLRLNYDNISKAEKVDYIVPRYDPVRKDWTRYILIAGFIILSFIIISYIIINSRRKKEMVLGGAYTTEVETDGQEEEYFDHGEDGVGEDETEEDWEDEFKKNVQDQKTVIISKGQFKTTESLGYLVLRSKKFGMNIYELKQSEIIIGRASTVDILIDDEEVSKLHAKVKFDEGKFILDDMGSSNGTYINNQIVFHAELKDGDIIKIGVHELVFKCI